jgi:hypothetical protein
MSRARVRQDDNKLILVEAAEFLKSVASVRDDVELSERAADWCDVRLPVRCPTSVDTRSDLASYSIQDDQLASVRSSGVRVLLPVMRSK